MHERKVQPERFDVLKSIFTSPFYILVTVVAAVAYYELFRYIIIVSNKGLFFMTVPDYVVYSLIISAAVLFTTSLYAISRSIHARYAGAEGSALSIATAAIGDLIVGCSCYAPILSSIMYAVGFGAIQVGDAISFLGSYQIFFVVAFVALNLIFIYYQLGRITRIGTSEHRR